MKNVCLFIILLFISCGSPTKRDPIRIFDVSTSTPKSLSWGDIDLNNDGIRENYLTSIKKQPCEDCYIYAVIGILEIQYQIDHGLNVSLDLSEQNVHNCLKITCSSFGHIEDVANYIKDYGILEEQYSPNGSWGVCKNCSIYIPTNMGNIYVTHIPFYKIKKWKFITYEYMTMKERKFELIKALQSGPVVVNTIWNYKQYGEALYCGGGKVGNHSIILVGYVNDGEAFLVKNSHGEGKLLKLVFNGSEKCNFASSALQIYARTTYVSWGIGENFCYSISDMDKDSVPDPYDNCPRQPNVDQKNKDKDMFGDVCDPCINVPKNDCREEKK